MNDNPNQIEMGLIPRITLPVMAEAYRAAVAKMKAALTELEAARESLTATFGKGGSYSHVFDYNEVWKHRYGDVPKPEAIEMLWRQGAWRILVDRMELKRICSVKRAAEIDKQLEDPKTLPDITEANMLAMIEGNAREVGTFLQEAITECFDQLRPYHWGDRGDGYKTNQIYQIGERVILSYAVSRAFGRGLYRLSYSSSKTQLIRCLDNVMHLLDGKGTVPTHAGPLIDALNGPENNGHVETEYFEAKCFKNQNLHLRFKRLDLLAELNLRGSGASPVLPGREKKRGQP